MPLLDAAETPSSRASAPTEGDPSRSRRSRVLRYISSAGVASGSDVDEPSEGRPAGSLRVVPRVVPPVALVMGATLVTAVRWKLGLTTRVRKA